MASGSAIKGVSVPWHIRHIKKIVVVLAVLAAIFAGLVVWQYFGTFSGVRSTDQATWGQFGDFVGGTLNPVFAFFAFIALLFTIVFQSHELAETRKELRASVHAAKHQTFEATFFQLLRLHHDIVKTIETYDITQETDPEKLKRQALPLRVTPKRGHEAMSYLNVKWFRSLREFGHATDGTEDNHSGFEQEQHRVIVCYRDFLNGNYDSLGHYFRNLYNLFRFVDESEDIRDDDKKKYTSIVRAQISSRDTELLFYNCLHPKHDKFLVLVERYALLEHLDFQTAFQADYGTIVPMHLFFYPMKAYGDRPPPLPDNLTLPSDLLDDYNTYVAKHPPVTVVAS